MEKSDNKIIILGAGLAGLTLAYELKKSGTEALILEARDRSGGRIHTLNKSGTTLELGATWFADKHQHLINLIQELGIGIVEQDYGQYAVYEKSNGHAQLYELPNQTETSYRIKGGTTQLIQALQSMLSKDQIAFDHQVLSLRFQDTQVNIETNKGSFTTQTVVNTLPPHLFAETIKCIPELPSASVELFGTTHTWMGESIKVGLFSKDPFWQHMKVGTIYSQKGPVTEMYDHSNEKGYALKGFVHEQWAQQPATIREQAVRYQLSRFFEKEKIATCDYAEMDWSTEPFTFKAYPTPVMPHQNNGNPLLAEPLFDGKLLQAGSETAPSFPGYKDGAVEAAKRVAELLKRSDRISI